MDIYVNEISKIIDNSLILSEIYFKENKQNDYMIEICKIHTLQIALKIYLDCKKLNNIIKDCNNVQNEINSFFDMINYK